jgi:FkbM family methyltransferase
MPVKLKSRLAAKLYDILLDSPVGDNVERSLVWLGHRYPYRYLPTQGAAIGQIAQRKTQDLVATLVDGTKIVVPPLPAGADLYLKGCGGEEETANLWRRFLSEGDLFFDIGAHMGVYTFMAAKSCGASGRVYAFEAQADLVGYLQKSVALNGYEMRVVVEHAAVADKHKDQVTLYLAKDKEATGIPSLLPHEWLDTRSGVSVPSISIDGYRQDRGIGKISALKIDIEGAEMFALRGMERTLAEAAPDLLVLEVLPQSLSFSNIAEGAPLRADYHMARPDELVSFLGKHGYECRQILKDGRIGWVYTLANLQDVTRATNVVFVSPDLKRGRPELFAS